MRRFSCALPPVEVLEAPPKETSLAIPPHAPLTSPQNGKFVVGNRGGPGRPKGSKSYAKILHKAAGKLAQAYVRTALKGNGTLLLDSRRYFVPDEDSSTGSLERVILFLGDPAQWPRAPQPVVAAPEPSTVPPLPVDVTPSLSDADG